MANNDKCCPPLPNDPWGVSMMNPTALEQEIKNRYMRDYLEKKMQQIAGISPLMGGQGALGAFNAPVSNNYTVLKMEKSKMQSLAITLEKIDNGFIVTAFQQSQQSGGISTELCKTFITDPTELGAVAIKALAIADMSK